MAQKFTDLSKFTDVINFDQDESNSQPISLTPQSPSPHVVENVDERPKRHIGPYKEFRSVKEIDPQYQNVFSYSYFNLVQSRIIDDALYSDKSVVVCAPTGTGKTVVFEMAIVKLLMDLKEQNYKNDFKVIYMAPVKAICTERMKEWSSKFSPLGLLCIEVTGDKDVDLSQLKPFSIIITTPEKWDMLTRRWRDYKGLVQAIKLFLIDEVHILNDKIRGPVLEVVVSRMKTIQTSAQFVHRVEQAKLIMENVIQEANTCSPQIRFIAVSATVSNPEDVASWLGTPEKPAVHYKFGDECRPVKIKRIVEGYPCADGASVFKFDIVLNYKLWPIIQKYYNGKPTLIFCNTRKSVMMTAETLCRELTINFSLEQKSKLAALASTVKNKKMKMLILNGIGCHHAGLLFEERVNIENAFRRKDLPILITTTTLAMGVNLPAHLVIIKNTQYYVNGQFQEYSISTILQMVGRAGRPQFDTEATAVIMTRAQDKHRYQALIEGSEPLESFLHRRLAENLNSEVALCTISDLVQGVQWLKSTFLYVRAARNPRKYLGLPHNAPAQQITYKIEELCNIAMNRLVSGGFVTMDETCCVQSTNVGHLMSVYYLDFETMKHFLKIEGSETIEKLLWVVCESHELADMHLRVDERRCLNALNRSHATATIRFPMKGKVSSRQMKLNCIIQAVLGCLHIPDPSLNQEALKIMRVAERVCKGMVAYVTGNELLASKSCFFMTVVNAVTLAKCIAARLWENSPYMTRQLKGIGPAFSTLLAAAGKKNFNLIEESHPRDLERIMNKGPPAGNLLRKQVNLLPKYQLAVTAINTKTVSVQLLLLNHSFLLDNIDNLTAGANHKFYIIVGDSENNLLFLTSFKDKELINVYDGQISQTVTRNHDLEYKIIAHCISTSYVGLDVQTEFTFKSLINTPDVLDVNRKMLENDIAPETAIQSQKRASKQMVITDMYKPRKRKTNTQYHKLPQEKRQKETILNDKLSYRKDPDKTVNKELKDDLEVMPIDFSDSTVISSCHINELNCEIEGEIVNSDLLKNNENLAEYEDLIPEDFESPMEPTITEFDQRCLQENYVNNIINDIESEISNTKNLESCTDKYKSVFPLKKIINTTNSRAINKIINKYEEDTTYPNIWKNKKLGNNNFSISKIYSSSCNIKNSNNKRHGIKRSFGKLNNYNVIDKIEKKNNATHEGPIQETLREDGFCTAAKLYLDQYFNTVKCPNERSHDSFLNLLQNDEKCEGKDWHEDQESTKEVVMQKNVYEKVANYQQIESEIDEIPIPSKYEKLNENRENINNYENNLNLGSEMRHESQEYKNYSNKKSHSKQKEKGALTENEQYEKSFCNDVLKTGKRNSESKFVPHDTFRTLATLPQSFNLEKHSVNSDVELADTYLSTNNNGQMRTLIRNENRVIDNCIANEEFNDEPSTMKLLQKGDSNIYFNSSPIKNIISLKQIQETNIQNEKRFDNEIPTTISTYNDRNGTLLTNLDDETKSKVFPKNDRIRILEKRERNCVFSIKHDVSIHSVDLLDNYSCMSTSIRRLPNNEVDIIQEVELDIKLKESTTFIIKTSKILNKGVSRQISYPDKNTSGNTCDTILNTGQWSCDDASETKYEYVVENIPSQNLVDKNVQITPQSILGSETTRVNIENLSDVVKKNEPKVKFIQSNVSEAYNTNVNNEANICVQDILKKYSNFTKKLNSDNTLINVENDIMKTNVKTNSRKSITKRPFNISEIYRTDRPLPDKFISKTNQKPLLFPEPCMNYHNCYSGVVEKSNECMTEMKRNDAEESNIDDAIVAVEKTVHLEEIDNVLGEKPMHQIMLNPMKLLQFHNTNNDDEVIIPPPPEFSDNFEVLSQGIAVLENEFDDDKNNRMLFPFQHQGVFQNIDANNDIQKNLYNENVSDVSSICDSPFLELKPTQEIMTLALSKDEPFQFYSSQTLLAPLQTSTTMRNNSPDDFDSKNVFSRNETPKSFYNVNDSLKKYCFTKEKMKNKK